MIFLLYFFSFFSFVIALFIVLSSGRVKKIFDRFSSAEIKSGFTGREISEKLLESLDLNDISVKKTPSFYRVNSAVYEKFNIIKDSKKRGNKKNFLKKKCISKEELEEENFSEEEIAGILEGAEEIDFHCSFKCFYKPEKKSLFLSSEVYDKKNMTAYILSAYTVARALQYKNNYFPNRLAHNILPPLVQISSFIYAILILISFLIANTLLYYFALLATIKMVIIFVAMLALVEYDAAGSGIKLLKTGGFITEEEQKSCKGLKFAATMNFFTRKIRNLWKKK